MASPERYLRRNRYGLPSILIGLDVSRSSAPSRHSVRHRQIASFITQRAKLAVFGPPLFGPLRVRCPLVPLHCCPEWRQRDPAFTPHSPGHSLAAVSSFGGSEPRVCGDLSLASSGGRLSALILVSRVRVPPSLLSEKVPMSGLVSYCFAQARRRAPVRGHIMDTIFDCQCPAHNRHQC